MLDRTRLAEAGHAGQVAIITGYNLALGHRSTTERALVAAHLYLEDLRLVKPRISQVAALAGVSAPYVNAAIAVLKASDSRLFTAVALERLSLLEAGVLAKYPEKTLVEKFIAAGATERLDLGRVAGVDVVFDTAIAPLL